MSDTVRLLLRSARAKHTLHLSVELRGDDSLLVTCARCGAPLGYGLAGEAVTVHEHLCRVDKERR